MEKIRKLDDRTQAREKLSIWFGSRDNYYHPIKEMLANAADELRNNYQENPLIEITLGKQDGVYKKITVEDNGRGIPISGETDGIPNYELLFLTLFAGTKYDVTDRASTGTNGVGNTTICYTSELFEVDSYYSKKHYHLKFEKGGKLTEELTEEKIKELKNGSKFSFILEKGIYTDNVFKIEEVEKIVKHFAVAALGIKFVFKFEDDNGLEVVKDFYYSDTKQYFEELIGSQSTSKIFTLGKIENETNVDLIDGATVKEKNSYDIHITTVPQVIQESYLNMTYLADGGAINDGVLDSVRLFMNKYCRDNKLFPAKITSFKKEDIESSIAFLAIVESNNVEFANQTKLSTNKDLYKRQAKEYIENLLKMISVQDPKQFKKITNHLLEVQKFNSANDKAHQKLKKKLTEKVEGIGNKVEKLNDCEKHGMEAELFLTEGDSANGSIIDSRDDEFQAAFPLRGKVLNVLKASPSKIFSNTEIVNMVKIIGTGIIDGKKNDFDISKARYGKIIITTDADADGGHIASLLIAFIYKYMTPLIEAGYIYVAQTPLYELKFNDDSVVYFLTEDEKNKNIDKYDDKTYVINRLKGLGEVDAEIMHETTMNPKTRNLVQLTADDAKKMSDMIVDWMGESVDRRKEMISDQLPNYVDNID